MKAYVVYFTFKVPGTKKPGPVKQYRLYANTLEEARNLMERQAAYPNIEILNIEPA